MENNSTWIVAGILPLACSVVSMALLYYCRYGDRIYAQESHRPINIQMFVMILLPAIPLGLSTALFSIHSPIWGIGMGFTVLGLYPPMLVSVIAYSKRPGGLKEYWKAVWYQLIDSASWGSAPAPFFRKQRTIDATNKWLHPPQKKE